MGGAGPGEEVEGGGGGGGGVTLFQTIVYSGDRTPRVAILIRLSCRCYRSKLNSQVKIFYSSNDLKQSFLTFSGSILQNDS